MGRDEYFASLHCPTPAAALSAAECQALFKDTYVWVDIMSTPQPAGEADPQCAQQLCSDLEAALNSVLHFIAFSRMVLILAPPIEHNASNNLTCNLGTWRSSGWW